MKRGVIERGLNREVGLIKMGLNRERVNREGVNREGA